MSKPTHEAIEAMRHVADNGSLTISQQEDLCEAVASGALDEVPDVKAAVKRRTDGKEMPGDLGIIGQHVQRVAPKYDD